MKSKRSKKKFEVLFKVEINENNQHFECIAILVNDVALLLIYNSSKNSLEQLIEYLTSCIVEIKCKKIIVVGDFNTELQSTNGRKLVNFMKRNDYNIMKTGVTTNSNTTIDYIFTKDMTIDSFIYESYFSFHKAICFEF